MDKHENHSDGFGNENSGRASRLIASMNLCGSNDFSKKWSLKFQRDIEQSKKRIDDMMERLNMRDDLIKQWRKEYFESKLRKLYAHQITTSHGPMGLRFLTQNLLHEKRKLNSLQDYVVVQGRPMSLEYKEKGSKKKPTSSNETVNMLQDGDISTYTDSDSNQIKEKKKFHIDIDVRGYIPEFIQIRTEDNNMTVTASKFNGKFQRSLAILGLTSDLVEQLTVHPPKNGVLTICNYNS